MNTQYGLDILFAEMPQPVETTLVLTQAQYDAFQAGPDVFLPRQAFVIDGHPAIKLYGDADSYKDCPDLGHC